MFHAPVNVLAESRCPAFSKQAYQKNALSGKAITLSTRVIAAQFSAKLAGTSKARDSGRDSRFLPKRAPDRQTAFKALRVSHS